MKRSIFFSLFLLLMWTSHLSAGLIMRSPEEMVRAAQFIVAGEVVEVRSEEEPPAFVVDVDTVYQGEAGATRLAIPMPPSSSRFAGESWKMPPAVGSRLLLFLKVNERGRVGTVADLNWAGILQDDRVTALYLGASYHNWDEKDYIEAYNRFLTEASGQAVPHTGTDAGEEGEKKEQGKRPGEVNPALFFMTAGVALILLIISAKIKKNA